MPCVAHARFEQVLLCAKHSGAAVVCGVLPPGKHLQPDFRCGNAAFWCCLEVLHTLHSRWPDHAVCSFAAQCGCDLLLRVASWFDYSALAAIICAYHMLVVSFDLSRV